MRVLGRLHDDSFKSSRVDCSSLCSSPARKYFKICRLTVHYHWLNKYSPRHSISLNYRNLRESKPCYYTSNLLRIYCIPRSLFLIFTTCCQHKLNKFMKLITKQTNISVIIVTNKTKNKALTAILYFDQTSVS